MSCSGRYNGKGIVFKTWVGKQNQATDCKVDGTSKRFLFLEIKSYRGDPGALDFKATTATTVTPKQLQFENPAGTQKDEWALSQYTIPGYASPVEQVEIKRQSTVSTNNESIFSTIEKCQHKHGYVITNVQMTLQVTL